MESLTAVGLKKPRLKILKLLEQQTHIFVFGIAYHERQNLDPEIDAYLTQGISDLETFFQKKRKTNSITKEALYMINLNILEILFPAGHNTPQQPQSSLNRHRIFFFFTPETSHPPQGLQQPTESQQSRHPQSSRKLVSYLEIQCRKWIATP